MIPRYLLYLLTLTYIIFILSIIYKTWHNNDISNVIYEDTRKIQKDNLEMQMFQDYVYRFNKTYSAREYKIRLKNFQKSLLEIARLNALEDNAVFGLTKFSDMSEQEFKEKMLMKRIDGPCVSYNRRCSHSKEPIIDRTTSQLPIKDKIDWREKGVISPVLDQKQCRGCWAISVAGVMDAMAKINKPSSKDLSVQEVLDCLVEQSSTGCRGGNVAKSLVILCAEHPYRINITTADNYPFTLKTENCQLRRSDTGITLKSFTYKCKTPDESVEEAEEYLQRALAKGPVTALVNAAIWRYYLGGTIRRACVRSDDSLEHAIQIVGYDRSAKVPYYIVKNSWGSSFGEHGYVKLEMYKNMCGISEEVATVDV